MSPMFVPGPVDVDETVAQAQTAPMLPHRSAEFEEIFHRVEGNARKLFFTDYRVIISASSGTGMHEAAVRNFVPEDGRVLSCSNGAFGNRWYDVSVTNGKLTDRLETDWGQPVTADTLLRFVASLDLPQEAKARLAALTPADYLGLARELARSI